MRSTNTFYFDNSGVVANLKEPRTHKKGKHIERKVEGIGVRCCEKPGSYRSATVLEISLVFIFILRRDLFCRVVSLFCKKTNKRSYKRQSKIDYLLHV